MTPRPAFRATRSFVQPGAGGMKAAATGMLVAMAALFLVARALEPGSPGWSFVKAFAEAAMVGGLADWFAVTALFRRPLGLPIPHTAIIPTNKDRIGDNLASFLRDNFLTPSVVARRMRKIDVAGAAGRFLENPPASGRDGATDGGRMRQGASRMAAGIIEALDDERLGTMAKTAISLRLKTFEVAPLLGQTLGGMIDDHRHVPMLENVLGWLSRTIGANEHLIRDMVHKRTGWVMRLTGLDTKLADQIVNGLTKLIAEMADDPGHPVRLKAEEALAKLAFDLKFDPITRVKVEVMKAEIIANPAVVEWIDRLWRQTRAGILRAARDPDAALAGKFGEALRELGRTLQKDARLRGAINKFVRRATVGAVASYGSGIVKLVSDTVRGWDAKTITDRLENAVGRDLQYIRINGTLVGGLVGLIIHAAEVWL